MITQPDQEITWGELHVGSRSIFADAGFTEVRNPTKTPSCDANRFLERSIMLRRDLDEQRCTAATGACNVDRPAECLDAVPQTDQARNPSVVGASDSVVANGEAFATAKGIGWVSRSPTLRTTRSVESGSGQVAESVFAVLDRLSARQREIVAALLRGERTSETAASMFLSQSTVRSHLSAIFNQFGVHSQTELLVLLRSQNAGRSTSN